MQAKHANTQSVPEEVSENQIQKLRNEIDTLDDEILERINKRLSLALEIGKVKAEMGARVLDHAREQTILNRLGEKNRGLLSPKMLHRIFTEIMAASRELQRIHRVSYLGPEATFTHMATLNHFGHGVSLIPQTSIRDVFLEVEKGACHFGVVPVENSIEGAVNHTLDLFYESELTICAEIYQTISHDLLSAGDSLKDIRTVFSHPQAFAQCRSWLARYLPSAELVKCSSTGEAARKAAEIPGTAAVASSQAAGLYHLHVLASRIEDVLRNTTRFLVIGREAPKKTGADKTSVMFVTTHVPGALFHVLKPIAEASINMVKLESRPAKHENWSYCFFVDMEGHIEDEPVKQTIEKMGKICLFLKHLGSYPRAPEMGG